MCRQFLDGNSCRKLEQVDCKGEKRRRLVFPSESLVALDTLRQVWETGRLELRDIVQGKVLGYGVLVVERQSLC